MQERFMKRLIVWNATSGKVVGQPDFLNDIPNRDLTSIVKLTRDINLQQCVAQAVEHGCDTVVVAGGDGTVNAAVNAIMKLEPDLRPQMSIVPLGTANDFAGSLGIPDAVDEALALLETTQIVPVDVVRIRAVGFERFYANIAAGGNSVRVSQEMTEEIKTRWGAYCYLRGALDVLTDLESYTISFQADEETFDNLGAWAVLLANGRTNAGRIVVAPNASPVDGLLDTIVIRDGTIVDILDIVSRALLGSYLESEQVIYRQVKRFFVHSHPGMRFTIDGEVIDEEPVEFEIVPGAISMYVGAQFFENYHQVANAARHPVHSSCALD
jgi:diacylglycerol kinase (ATP)